MVGVPSVGLSVGQWAHETGIRPAVEKGAQGLGLGPHARHQRVGAPLAEW